MKKVSSSPLISNYGALTNKTTTVNTMADVGAIECGLLKTKTFGFTATDNTLSVEILGSLDGGATYPHTVEAAFDVTTATPVTKAVSGYYSALKVRVKPKVNDTHGTLATQWAGASL